MLPSSPLAPFTPAILAELPNPEPEPRSDQLVEPDQNPLAPMAPLATTTEPPALWSPGPNGSVITGSAVGIGNSDPQAMLSIVTSPGGADVAKGLSVAKHSDDNNPPIYYSWKTRGTVANPQPVAPGDWIMYFGWGADTASGTLGNDMGALTARMTDSTRADFIIFTNDGTAPENGYERMRITGTGYIIMGMPTSSAGLPSGALWNNGGAVHIVP